MLMLFATPVVMILLFGYAIRTDVRDVRTVVVTSQMDGQTQQIVNRIGASEYFNITATAHSAAEAEALMRAQQADVALVFSPHFGSSRYDDAAIQILTDAADPNMAQQYQNYIGQILAESLSTAPSPILVKQLYNPSMQSAYNFVPGLMGLILMLICTIMTSNSIVREKERGTMEVLLVSPVRPLVIIISKAVPYLLLSFLVVIVILVMSRFVLAVPIAGSLFLILSVSALYILLSLSLGLIISNVSSTQLAALLGAAMVLLVPSLMLSGLIYPVSSMPWILQVLSNVVPATHYISVIRKLMIMGVGLEQVAREVGILLLFTAVLLTVAFLTFKRRLQ